MHIPNLFSRMDGLQQIGLKLAKNIQNVYVIRLLTFAV